ncbi:unnamed protein product [Heligmosomoides polygyrus]|uniref:LETM1 domain-containing protein n=1 Tax=Heligmosomoides polygyrus TaxID=6339 RepID=A0A183FQR9_HELPZ|nr:unnamed protein product [Heligmosomoides polygyrus]
MHSFTLFKTIAHTRRGASLQKTLNAVLYRFPKLLLQGLKRNTTAGQSEPIFEANSFIMVLITVAGRMANVVGTMKMYKGLGKFFSDRKRKKFRKATERVQSGETEVEFTELFSECCQVF